MPTTDTFIIPPINTTTETKGDNQQQKNNPGKGKWALFIGLVILIISLPIGVYYFSQQQTTDIRSRASGGRTAEGTFHNCGYLNNTGSSGPAQSSCDSTNCGNKPCGVFTFKCGKYCLDTSCGKAACYDDPPKTPTPTLGPTATVTPTAEPTNPPAQLGQCDASCDSDSNCESGLSCSSVDGVNRCRNSSCPAESGCSCPAATDVSGDAMPVSGTGPGILGSLTVIGSVLLLIAGLAL